MLEHEREKLGLAHRLQESGQTREAFRLLKEIKAGASTELETEDIWQVHELFGACFHDFGDAEGAAQAYWRAAQSDRFLRSQRQHLSNYLFCLHYLPGISDEEMFRQHLLYGKLFQDVSPLPILPGRQDSRIRVGYLATSFMEQSTARFFEVLLTGHDRSAFEVYGYCLDEGGDALSRRIQNSVDAFRALGKLPLEEAAEAIHRDNLDILFDLGGHSAGGTTLMISAYRPARIVISGIGWFDTTGLSGMDYILADGCTARGTEAFFTEKLLTCAHQFCYTPHPAMRQQPLPAPRDGEVVFGCFNNFMKITDDMLRCWQGILHDVPGSRLILKDTTPLAARQETMQERVASLGMQNVELRRGSEDYLAEYREIDIALDTCPYPGGTTTCEALYLGIPVITMAGTRYGSRFGQSLLTAAGLSDFVAFSPAEYHEKAVALAMDEKRRKTLKTELRGRIENSALMDAGRYMRNLEEQYKNVLNLLGEMR